MRAGSLSLARCVVVLGFLVLVGCSGGTGRQVPPEENRIKVLALLYGRYMSSHKGQAPPNEAEFKKFIRAQDESQLGSIGAKKDAIDEIFISPRDNQHYVVRYAIKVGTPDAQGHLPIIAYEQTGVGGKRFVAYSMGDVKELPEADLKAQVPGAK